MTSQEEFNACLLEIIHILGVNSEMSDKMFRNEFRDINMPKKPEYKPNLFSMITVDLLKMDLGRSVRLAELKGEIDVLTKQLSICEESRCEGLRNDLQNCLERYCEILESYDQALKLKEIDNLKQYDKYYEGNLDEFEEKLLNWKRDKYMWIPCCPSESDLQILYEEYLNNPKYTIDRIIEAFHYPWMPFKSSIMLDLNYARTITNSEKEAMCLYKAIVDNSNYGRQELLKNFEFNIQELLNITKLFTNPPYPLMNCQHEDEYQIDASQQFDMISNENLRFMIEATNNFFNLRGQTLEYTSVVFNFSDGQHIENIPNTVISVFPKLGSNVSFENQTLSKDVIDNFVRALYTGTFDRNITNLTAGQLCHLFEQYEMIPFTRMCYLVPFIRSKKEVNFICDLENFEHEEIIEDLTLFRGINVVNKFINETENDEDSGDN